MDQEDILETNRILNNFQELKDFSLVQNLYHFSSLLIKIFDLCNEHYIIWDENSKKMSEDKLYKFNIYYLRRNSRSEFSLYFGSKPSFFFY